jgi:hypothetical protein
MPRSAVLWTFIALVAAVAGCSATPHPAVVYTPPASTPYHHKPRLEQQYLKAHKAGWRNVVLNTPVKSLQRTIAREGFSIWSTTCCEATRNVTAGWYRGQEDARRFLDELAVRGATDPTVISGYKALQLRLEDAPVTDWFVGDYYTPAKLTKELARDGKMRIERTYRDATKQTLFHVARYSGEVLDGNTEDYDANGELSTITPYRMGVIDGVQRGYSDTGALVGEVLWRQGQKQGAAVHYSESGDLLSYVEWLDNEQDGKEILFYEDGRCYRYFGWKNGQKHGLCVNYNIEGQETGRDSAEYRAGVETRKIAPLTPTSALPEEYRPAALQDFRQSHRRAPDPASP